MFIRFRETVQKYQFENSKSCEKLKKRSAQMHIPDNHLCASDNDSRARANWQYQVSILHSNLSVYSQFYCVCIGCSMSMNTFCSISFFFFQTENDCSSSDSAEHLSTLVVKFYFCILQM